MSALACIQAGVASQARQQWSAAQAHFERAIQADPQLAQAYGSLGLLRQQRGGLPAAEQAYLTAAPEWVHQWSQRLPQPGLGVGLVWKGNTHFENDAKRSLPQLELLAPLWQVPSVAIISLQKGAGEDQARNPPQGQALLDLGSAMADFADAAAIIESLDLVITVDTAMAQLTGAMGKPCWLLLPQYKTD